MRAIYGAEGQISLFEATGRALFEACDRPNEAESLKAIFENSLYFIFRLILLAHLEARYGDALELSLGPGVWGLQKISRNLVPNSQERPGWGKLRHLFAALAPGQPPLKRSPLSVGLFDPAKAPLLTLDQAFSEEFTRQALTKLGPLNADKAIDFRDFANLSPAHLGNIYEGLLDYEFRVASNSLVYATINSQNNIAPTYYLKKDIDSSSKDIKIIYEYKKGDIYLFNSRNSRKHSGSYYTPDCLAAPLVTQGLERLLAGPFKARSILDIRVLDCACGGGRLLLVALNALAQRALARLKTEKKLRLALDQEIQALKSRRPALGLGLEAAAPAKLLALKRIFLQRAIYGVDISSFAVELTRLALWLETFIFGVEAPFTENHLKTGDSLLGEGAASLGSGSDQDFAGSGQPLEELKKAATSLNSLTASPTAETARIRAHYYEKVRPAMAKINHFLNNKIYLDILKAHNSSSPPWPPLELKTLEPGQPSPKTAQEQDKPFKGVEGFQQVFRFFHWPIEFPEIFLDRDRGDPGFDLIIGNPPWDKIKFEEPLFFSQFEPNYRSLPNSRKKIVAKELLQRPDIREKHAREKEKYTFYNALIAARFPLCQGAGDNNLFRYFVERALRLLAPGGNLSYILPTALLTDHGSLALRKWILENFRLTRFDGFENKKMIFPAVHARYKFGLIQIENVPDPRQVAQTRFMLTDPKALTTDQGYFPYALADVQATSPKHWAYMESSGGRKDLAILKKLYAKFPPLSPDWLDFRNELHATDAKRIFHERLKPGFAPLYKGEMIWQYQPRLALPKYWVEPVELDAYLLGARLKNLKHDLKAQYARDKNWKKPGPGGFQWPKILRSLQIADEKDLAQFIVPERSFFRLAFRAIASDTNERTLIAALIPPDIAAQNSLWISIPGHYALDLSQRRIVYQKVSLARLLFAQALFNSLPLDWILRASMAMNVNKTYVQRLPMPQPAEGELATNPIFAALVRDSALLSLYHCPELLVALGPTVTVERAQIPADSQAFDKLKAALDVQVASLYGLSLAEMVTILKGFRVLRAKYPHYLSLLLSLAQLSLKKED